MSDINQLIIENINSWEEKKLHKTKIADLNISSGRVVACDPLVPTKTILKFEIPMGQYPVYVIGEPKEVAFAVLELNSNIIETVKEDLFYPVDAGMGCFMDASIYNEFENLDETLSLNNPDYISFYDSVIDGMMENQPDLENLGKDNYLNYIIEGKTNNVIMFRSGWGDGYYPSYGCFDKDGNLCAIITDFQLLTDNED